MRQLHDTNRGRENLSKAVEYYRQGSKESTR